MKLLRRASSAGIVIWLHREPHRPERCQDFSLHGKPGVNGVFRIEQRLLESAFERVVFFRSTGGFKHFARNVFERPDTGAVKARMSQAFAVRFAARDAETGISPQFAFV